MINLNEASQKIKTAGAANVRVVPMPGQSTLNGLHQIEIKNGPGWFVVAEGMQRKMAYDLVTQALNKVILG